MGIHLHDRLLHIHRLERETLRLDNGVELILLRNRLGKRLDRLCLEPALTETPRKLRFLFANLTLKLLDDQINGAVHIL